MVRARQGREVDVEDVDRDKYEARLRRKWPLLQLQDLADLALGQASLLEVLRRRYEGSTDELEAEIRAFDIMTPPPELT